MNKGCTYWIDGLPAGDSLLVGAEYLPLTAWVPPCSGIPAATIATSQSARLTLPEAPNVKATVDLLIDSERCAF